MNTYSIQLNGVSIGYPSRRHGFRVVGKGLSAEASGSTITCLIGRNGAGKSTLLRTVARMQPRLGGSIMMGGRDIDDYSADDFARLLGIVLTQRTAADNITVEQLVSLGRAPYTGFWGHLSADDRRVVGEAMCAVGVDGMCGRRVSSLSDGEHQKVMIAKALAQSTPFILLDEPTAFLDYPGKIELMQLLARLAHTDGKTILLSTHDLDTALQTADRLWLLDSGGIEQGTPPELARNGAIERYVGRADVELDRDGLYLRITRQSK